MVILPGCPPASRHTNRLGCKNYHAGDFPTESHTRASSLGKLSAGIGNPCNRAGLCNRAEQPLLVRSAIQVVGCGSLGLAPHGRPGRRAAFAGPAGSLNPAAWHWHRDGHRDRHGRAAAGASPAGWGPPDRDCDTAMLALRDYYQAEFWRRRRSSCDATQPSVTVRLGARLGGYIRPRPRARPNGHGELLKLLRRLQTC